MDIFLFVASSKVTQVNKCRQLKKKNDWIGEKAKVEIICKNRFLIVFLVRSLPVFGNSIKPWCRRFMFIHFKSKFKRNV